MPHLQPPTAAELRSHIFARVCARACAKTGRRASPVTHGVDRLLCGAPQLCYQKTLRWAKENLLIMETTETGENRKVP